MEDESLLQCQSVNRPRSVSNVLVEQKGGSNEVEETSTKRVKMRDLESVFRSEAQAGRGGSKTEHSDIYSNSGSLDLNIGIGSKNCIVNDDDPGRVDESNNPPICLKKCTKHDKGLTEASGFSLDLNATDISSSINGPVYKMNGRLKCRDDSDCGSSVDPFEKDPMGVWRGLKQNNYMSTPCLSVPMAILKARGRRKSIQEVLKRKKERTKNEQADKIARLAAPSDLLKGLNPGIINHVRNSKHVHSIIEAIVRSERSENLKRNGQNKSEDMRSLTVNTSGCGHRDALLQRKGTSDYSLFSKFVNPSTEIGTRAFPVVPSQCGNKNEDYKLAQRLSSCASQNASCLSNDKSANLRFVTSLSFKASNVASQWLELLSQDIRGRLAALRRSRKRVLQVINKDLRILMSTEFTSTNDKDLNTTKGSTADAHSVKWNNLFAQMDKSLSEEETNLDNWLSQVEEMQLHCKFGVNENTLNHSSHQMAPIGNNSRSGVTDNSDKDLAVIRSHAAALYSTCNYLLSRENLPCH